MASEVEGKSTPLSPEVRLLIDLDLSVVISPNWKTFGDFRA